MLRFFKDSESIVENYTPQDFIFRLTKLSKITAKENLDSFLLVCGIGTHLIPRRSKQH